MSERDDYTAALLDSAARALASDAAERLLESRPDLGDRYKPDPFAGWMEHFTGRLAQLASSLGVGAPEVFAADAAWSRSVFAARGVPEADLLASLDALERAVAESLPSDAAQACAACFTAARTRLTQPLEQPPPLRADAPSARLAAEYLEAALEGDRRRAVERILRAVEEGADARAVYLDSLVAAQREIGRMWHAGEITIAEEHAATAATELAMSLLHPRLARAEPHGKTAIVAGVSGNAHRLAVRIVADMLECDGWRVVDLAADLPARDIVQAAADFRADLVCLSATLSTHLRALREVVASMREEPSTSEVKILVGGQAIDAAPAVWRGLGADATASDAMDAQRVARRLVGLPVSA